MLIREGIRVGAMCAALVLLFVTGTARACSIVYRVVEVGRGFRVRVMDRGRPVKGLRVRLGVNASSASGGKGAIYAVTDFDGYAHFPPVDSGQFFVDADHDAGIGDGVGLDVSPGGPPNVTLTLKWPSRTPIEARSASGIIRGPDYYPSRKEAALSLVLMEGLSGRTIATTSTDSMGRFKFVGEVPPGIYFIRLKPSGLVAWDGEQMEGTIAVELNRQAEQQALDIDLGWSSCGLGYAHRQEYPELRLAELCGEVTDVAGAEITNARVFLLATSDNGEIVEQTESDAKGHFAFKEQREGVYQLLIKSPGFLPFLSRIRVEGSGPVKDCRHPARVELDVGP